MKNIGNVMANQNKQRIYLRALRELRKLIDSDYKDGGKLFSERIMCEELGVSRMTYRKVLGWLARENMIKSYPSRGHWVFPEYLRCKKVGIILQGGRESPFLGSQQFVGICADLLKQHYYAHIIQASPLENLGFASVTHAVRGLIWIWPKDEELHYLKSVHDEEGLPVLAVLTDPGQYGDRLNNIPYIGWDMPLTMKYMAEYYKKQGYERVVHIGSNDREIHRELAGSFRKVGLPFDMDQIICEEENITERLQALHKKYKLDAVLTSGDAEIIHELFNYCSGLSASEQPTIILPSAFWILELLKKYPNIKKPSFRKANYEELTGNAVEMMVESIKTGSPIQSQVVQNYFIDKNI